MPVRQAPRRKVQTIGEYRDHWNFQASLNSGRTAKPGKNHLNVRYWAAGLLGEAQNGQTRHGPLVATKAEKNSLILFEPAGRPAA
jgi:hypothetical protein